MKKKSLSILLALCLFIGLLPQGFAVASASDGLCEHHQSHTEDCGYSEGTEGSPCTHEHTEDCYVFETNCVHQHDESCYPEGETEPTACTHVCSEESGCITKQIACTHEHDETCGYVEEAEGTPCTFECEICNAKEIGDFFINGLPAEPEYRWESEDGMVSAVVVFTGEASLSGKADAEPLPVLNVEQTYDVPVVDGDADAAPLFGLKIHLFSGEEEIDLSGCTAEVTLEVDSVLLAPPMLLSDADAPAEESEDMTLSVSNAEGTELAAVPAEEGKTTLTFILTFNAVEDGQVTVSAAQTADPPFVIQHYLRYEKVVVDKTGTPASEPEGYKTSLEVLDTSLDGVFQPVTVKTKNARKGIGGNGEPAEVIQPVYNGPDPVKDNISRGANDSFYVRLIEDGTNAGGKQLYSIQTAQVSERMFRDEVTSFHLNPTIANMNRFYDGDKNFNENYTLSEVWVYQPGKNYTMPEDLTEATIDKLTKEAGSGTGSMTLTVYPVPEIGNRHDPSQIAFTNNIGNPHISPLDNGKPKEKTESNGTPYPDGYDYTYTILIQKGTIVRLVFDGQSPTDADGNEKEFIVPSERVRFFDYDISDGEVYTDKECKTKSTEARPGDDALAATVYMKTMLGENGQDANGNDVPETLAGQGINSPGNYEYTNGKAIYAFGNTNTGTGALGSEQKLEGRYIINGRNGKGTPPNSTHNSYKSGVYGLVTGTTKDTETGFSKPTFAEGVAAPTELFGPVTNDVEGKTVYDDYTLGFQRKGGTFTLSSVYKHPEAGQDSQVLDNLDKMIKTSDSAFATGLPVYSNEFWPLDTEVVEGEGSYGTAGHDFKFGTLSDSEHRQFAGQTSGALPTADINNPKVNGGSNGSVNHNAYLSMSYTVDFEIPPGYCTPMNYWFYGDDDMWVFLDKLDEQGNVVKDSTRLVADVGGLHPAIGEYVDLWEYVDENPLFEKNADGTDKLDANGRKIENTEGQSYRLTVFWTERGASGSTCYMRFNIPQATHITPAPPYNGELVIEKIELDKNTGNAIPWDKAENEFEFTVRLDKTNTLPLRDSYDYDIYEKKGQAINPRNDRWDRGGVVGDRVKQDGVYEFELKSNEYIIIHHLPDDTRYTVTEKAGGEGLVTYYRLGTYISGGSTPTLGPVTAYSEEQPIKHKILENGGTQLNYVRFVNGPPIKTEKVPGNGENVAIGDEITYEIDWAKAKNELAATSNYTQTDTPGEIVTVQIEDKLDEGLDFMAAKFNGTEDTTFPWWTKDGDPVPKPEGITVADVSYDEATRIVTWNLTYNTAFGTPDGKVALKVKVNEQARVTRDKPLTPGGDDIPWVFNDALVKVGKNDTIRTNRVENPLSPGVLEITKHVTGNAEDKQKAFQFTIKLTDPAGNPVQGTYGDVIFDSGGKAIIPLRNGETIRITGLPVYAAGNLRYEVTEAEEDADGYTTSITATGETKIDNRTISGEVVPYSLVSVAFTNHKPGGGGEDTPDPATVTITARKTLNGAAPVGSDYSFVLKDERGNTLQTVRNKGGNITFDPLSFSSTGTFTYTVSEVLGTDSTINYDTAVYKVIVEVTKPGGYKATVSYKKNGEAYDGALTFANTTKQPGDDTVSVSVDKVWQDNAGEKRPDSVKVQLYKNGVACDSVELNEANGWRYVWTDLEQSEVWTVGEVDVPDGYSAETAHTGNNWTITNTFSPPPDTPDNPDKPDVPDTPDKPDTPDNPDKPDVPDTPDKPDTPDNPDTPDGVPKTGDSTHLELYLILAFLALAGMGATGFAASRLRYVGAHEKRRR